ncbi:MAG: type I 3-dehydroquinate dehydratase [Planctomycetota bacterium]
MTRLCVPIFVRGIEQARKDIAGAVEAGADVIELRLDAIESEEDVLILTGGFDIPFILTARTIHEGGEDTRSVSDRLSFLRACREAVGSATHVDMEAASLEQLALGDLPEAEELMALEEGSLIASAHDFKGRPATLTKLFAELRSMGDIPKVAWQARSIRDNVEAFELLEQAPGSIVLCMGEAGLMSRVLAKKFGAYLTFASLRDTSATAPGQPTIDELKTLYRWDRIGRRTKVFGVVADPVAHSMSPAVHNAAFDATGYDGVYLPMLVQGSYESFKAFMETVARFTPLHLTGLSVTIPHKEHALRYLDEIGSNVDPLARTIGAVNTLDRVGESWHGRNTDCGAIVESVGDVAGKHCVVLGAGGTARAAVAGILDAGGNVTLLNRTRSRAEKIADDFPTIDVGDWDERDTVAGDVYLNTTSIGMSPDVDASPYDTLPPMDGATVFDAVYNPIETRLLREARVAGARTVSGLEMFVRQAAAQSRGWTGLDAPNDIMRATIEAALDQPS